MNIVSVHNMVPVEDYPVRPAVGGRVSALPKEVFASLGIVAGCASVDPTRQLLNGVLMSPENGGLLVATDGRRLASAPVRFTGRSMILPNAAAHALLHPDFATRDAALRQSEEDDGKTPYAEFRSGPHTLIAKEIEGSYPNYHQVVPTEFLAEATIPETRIPALVAWLRSLSGNHLSVRLSWEQPGLLTLTRMDGDEQSATIQVPVFVEGTPPIIGFDPRYMAYALECTGRLAGAVYPQSASGMAQEERGRIGPVLRLIDGMSPGLLAGPGGVFCVIMPMRCHAASIPAPVAVPQPQPQPETPAAQAVAA